MIYNIKNKNTFFSPGETPSSGEVVALAPTTDTTETRGIVVLPYTSSKTKRKKRNLVSSMGPLIIKVTETKEIERENEGQTIKQIVPYKINKSYNDILNAYLNDQKIKILSKTKFTATKLGLTTITINITASGEDALDFVIQQTSKHQFYTVSFGESITQKFIAFSPDEPMTVFATIQDEVQELINGDNSLDADPTGEQEVVVNPTPGKVADDPSMQES